MNFVLKSRNETEQTNYESSEEKKNVWNEVKAANNYSLQEKIHIVWTSLFESCCIIITFAALLFAVQMLPPSLGKNANECDGNSITRC